MARWASGQQNVPGLKKVNNFISQLARPARLKMSLSTVFKVDFFFFCKGLMNKNEWIWLLEFGI